MTHLDSRSYTSPRILRSFSGPNLLQVAMPIGGIGAGCLCLNGSGGLQDFAVRNRPATTAMPDGHGMTDSAFALVHLKGSSGITKLVEGPLPPEKLYDQALQGQGYRKGGHEGLPRFETATFEAGYPFGIVQLQDSEVPLAVSVTGWSPFIPNDDLASSLPATILEYRFENTGSESVEFDFSYHLSHLAGESAAQKGAHWPKTYSKPLASQDGILFGNTLAKTDEDFGTAVLGSVGWTPRIKAMWLRGGWFDGLSALWREVSTGKFVENDGSGPIDDPNSRSGGSILGSSVLGPGESVVFPVVIAWHFPNSNMAVGGAPTPPTAPDCGPDCDCNDLITLDTSGSARIPAPAWRPFYAGVWPDAAAVAAYVTEHFDSLRARTLAFADALLSSTLPVEALDAISSNLAILKSPTVLRQENGNVWAWEGCFTGSGCCHGSCTHVWNYAQSLPHLFPKLERTLREQELTRSMDERGHINFRSALPDGPVDHNWHAAADGQLGGILKIFRDWQISGDQTWLENLYPCAKLSLDYCIAVWDPDRKGGLFEPHHNTYDIEFWGPDGMCGSVYAGALAAMAAMARALGRTEDAETYQALAETAALFMDEHLFNGEYYQQNVQWEGLRNTSFAESIAGADVPASETQRLLKAEGPKYQYGSGCISDGVIGAWMAAIYGVETPMSRDNVRATLQAIFRHNYRDDLFDHACLQRPGYALGHEAGLLLCSWPRGGKPTLPFVYSDEVWTGIEYQVASHLIYEGMVEEGLTVVRGVRSRYDGHVRNPFNEYECGSYYARAMASYALLGTLSGFRYSAVDHTLWFGPKLEIDPFQTFFSTASAYGTIRLEGDTLTITVLEGELRVETLILTRKGETQTFDWDATATPDATATLRLTEAVGA